MPQEAATTDLERRLAQALRELSEARDQQAATSDVLRIISSSPGELNPVFQAILANATSLCEAKFANLFLCEGDAFRVVAMHNAPPAYAAERLRQPLRHGLDSGLSRCARTKQMVQIPDLLADPAAAPMLAKFAAARTILAAPILKDSEVIGVIIIYRQEVRPFTDKQIELVQNFARQAVIAIENTRLLNELRESLAQQTATSEVLGVISSSRGELKRVFETMLENATRICGAKFGNFLLCDGNAFRVVAMHEGPAQWAELRGSSRSPLAKEPSWSRPDNKTVAAHRRYQNGRGFHRARPVICSDRRSRRRADAAARSDVERK